jgi:hypothetical protein
MISVKTLLSNIAAISPRSIGILIIVGGWEPIYQILLMLGVLGPELSGFFIIAALICSVFVFLFDYWRLKRRRKHSNYLGK